MTRSSIRATGFAALAAAAIGIWFGMAPDSTGFDATHYDAALSAARTANLANEAEAESAPQQQVTNGWVARDLLEIQSEQLSEIGTLAGTRDTRTPALLVIAVLTVCWYGVTTQIGTAPESRVATPRNSDPPTPESPEIPDQPA